MTCATIKMVHFIRFYMKVIAAPAAAQCKSF